MNRKTMRNAERKRILVVDDKASDTQLVKCFLESTREYVVREENDPLVALAAAEEFLPHLVLMDLLMPGMDGAELADLFQASSKLKAVPIIFLTAKLTKEEVDLCDGRIGSYPFLAKPFVLTELAECLKRHLAQAARR